MPYRRHVENLHDTGLQVEKDEAGAQGHQAASLIKHGAHGQVQQVSDHLVSSPLKKQSTIEKEVCFRGQPRVTLV